MDGQKARARSEPEQEAEEFIPEEFLGIPEPELDEDSGQAQAPEDPIFEDISETESVEDDTFLPEDAELSLDDELFDPDSPLEADSTILDGELEPDEAMKDDLFSELDLDEDEDWLTDFPEEEIEEPQFFPEELSDTPTLAAEEIPQDLFGSEPEPEQLPMAPEYLDDGISDPIPIPVEEPGASNPYSEISKQPSKPDTQLAPSASPSKPNLNENPTGGITMQRVDNVAKAKLFEYLLNMTKDLPGEKAREAEEKRLPERLETIRQALLEKTEVPPGVRTGVDRRKGPRRTESEANPQPQISNDDDVFGDTFSMLGKIGKLLPSDQKLELRDRMKKIIDVMEKYRH